MARKGGRIRPRVAGAKAVASALTIGSGGSAGTEGPIIQIGAAIGSSLGQWLQCSLADMRVLIGCGAAAGIAAIFNAPIAGVLFAVEVLLRDVSLRSFVPIIVAAVSSITVSQAIRGHNDPIFPVPVEFLSNDPVYRFSVIEIGNYAVLGLICGLVAWAFVRLLYLSEDLFRKLPVHKIARPVIGAAMLGLLAVGTQRLIGDTMPGEGPPTAIAAAGESAQHAPAPLKPATMGNGYPVLRQSLEPLAYTPRDSGMPSWTIQLLLLLLVGKVLATCFTLGSGGSGGVFAPSLYIGATTGGAFGLLVQATGWFPDVGPGGYALVGMAAVVAASIHAPLTAGLMLFELTGDYEVIIPIMITGVIGLTVARRLEPASIYTLKLLRRGVDIHKGQDISVLKHLFVRDAIRHDALTVPPAATAMEIAASFIEHPGTSIFVTDEDHTLRGMIADADTRPVLADAAAFGPFLIAADMMKEGDFPTVCPSDTLADVMRRLGHHRGEVPVVENGKLVGVIWPEDVIQRYNAELFKREMASGMAATLGRGARREAIPSLQNVSVAEIATPRTFVGKSVSSLDIRNRFQATILMIKKRGAVGPEITNAVPSADYVFQPDDVMLVMGPNDQLRRLERGELG